jgi:hypothetical protein
MLSSLQHKQALNPPIITEFLVRGAKIRIHCLIFTGPCYIAYGNHAGGWNNSGQLADEPVDGKQGSVEQPRRSSSAVLIRQSYDTCVLRNDILSVTVPSDNGLLAKTMAEAVLFASVPPKVARSRLGSRRNFFSTLLPRHNQRLEFNLDLSMQIKVKKPTVLASHTCTSATRIVSS